MAVQTVPCNFQKEGDPSTPNEGVLEHTPPPSSLSAKEEGAVLGILERQQQEVEEEQLPKSSSLLPDEGSSEGCSDPKQPPSSRSGDTACSKPPLQCEQPLPVHATKVKPFFEPSIVVVAVPKQHPGALHDDRPATTVIERCSGEVDRASLPLCPEKEQPFPLHGEFCSGLEVEEHEPHRPPTIGDERSWQQPPPPLPDLRSENGFSDPKEPPPSSSPRPNVGADDQVTPATASATKIAGEDTVKDNQGKDGPSPVVRDAVPVVRRECFERALACLLFSFAGHPACRHCCQLMTIAHSPRMVTTQASLLSAELSVRAHLLSGTTPVPDKW